MTLVGPWGTDLAFRIMAIAWPGWLFAVLTFGTIAFELSAGFALFHRRLRLPVMALGLGAILRSGATGTPLTPAADLERPPVLSEADAAALFRA